MNSQKMIRLSVIAALAGVYGSAFAGTTYYKGTNFIDQTYENVVGTKPSEHYGAVMAFYPTNADDVFNIRNCVFKEALQKPPLPSRMEQKCSVRLFLTTPECAVFFANTIVEY